MGKGWTEERRKQQAERIRQTKPWKKSTGPKTKGGKDRSKYNALKHGKYSKKQLEMRAALWKQYAALDALTKAWKKNAALERALNELKKKRYESILNQLKKFSPDQTEEKSDTRCQP